MPSLPTDGSSLYPTLRKRLWPIPDLLKFLVIAVSSFGLVLLAYEYVIRRVNLLRFLFGMRPLAQAAQPQAVRRAA